jgi:hypothetical protein
MATVEEYTGYHNYVLAAAGAFTAAAKTIFLSEVYGEDGLPVEQISLTEIVNYGNQAQKDSFLYDVLRQMERFEQTSANLGDISNIAPVREIVDGSASVPVPTPTPTPTPTP